MRARGVRQRKAQVLTVHSPPRRRRHRLGVGENEGLGEYALELLEGGQLLHGLGNPALHEAALDGEFEFEC